MSKIYTSADQLVGNTPLLELCRIEKYFNIKSKIFAKLEYLNPAGSVKDRIAKAMIEDAEKSGKLKADSVIIEPTSGNTGIGLASMASVKGYKCIIVMPDNMSAERIKLMSTYGAKIVLSDGKKGMKGAIEKADELSRELPNSFIPNQFSNPVAADIHYHTTGVEIWNAMDGKVDYFVTGIGSGGTLTGSGRFLKEQAPDIKIVGVEPSASPFLTKGKAGTHGIQGIGAGFIPEVLDTSVYDDVIAVNDDDAINFGKLICQKEGISVGISSGAALWASLEIAKQCGDTQKNIVVIFPDSGDRYLSTKLFD